MIRSIVYHARAILSIVFTKSYENICACAKAHDFSPHLPPFTTLFFRKILDKKTKKGYDTFMCEIQSVLEKITVNPQGEKVTVLGASKTRTAEEIIAVYRKGVTVMGENRAQEFTAKYDAVHLEGIPYRFIGRLQTNKVKYLIGKVDMIESVDRDDVLNEISKRSVKAGVTTRILLEINGGNEESKGGYALTEIPEAVKRASNLPGVKICGLMAVLPDTDNKAELTEICTSVRKVYDELKAAYEGAENVQFTTLSMGMSGDYEIAISCGSNEIRLGRILFGERNYA